MSTTNESHNTNHASTDLPSLLVSSTTALDEGLYVLAPSSSSGSYPAVDETDTASTSESSSFVSGCDVVERRLVGRGGAREGSGRREEGRTREEEVSRSSWGS